jgi:hypothetical protein
MPFSPKLEDLMKREHLQDLIGKTHLLILRSISRGEKCVTEIFDEIKGQNYITAQFQVVRATDQLRRLGCVRATGKKRTGFMAASEEPTYGVTDLGRILLSELEERHGKI